jgi:hypothetical protein
MGRRLSPNGAAALYSESSGMWFELLLAVLVAIPVFLWAYERHLDVLTGPWILRESNRDQP